MATDLSHTPYPMKTHKLNTYTHTTPFTLESGEQLNEFDLAYTTYGELNEQKDNVIWVFHALTGNADPAEWWEGLFGDGNILDTRSKFIICVNMPGSCYGSSGPLSINPATGAPFYHDFPLITVRDMVRMYDTLRQHLGIQKIHLAIGGSMGGMQAVEWAIAQPSLFSHLALIATNANHSPWGIAFNATQRMAIEADQTWLQKNEQAGINGLKVARAIAMLSYRNYYPYKETQSETRDEKLDHFLASNYQYYQGEKLAKRFNAFSYYWLGKSMDSHHVGRGRKSISDALHSIQAKTIVIGIESDLLFPVEEQLYLASHIPHATFHLIDSSYGHDGFLIETEQLNELVGSFLNSQQLKYA